VFAAKVSFPPVLPQQPSRNHLRLNFRGSFKDVEDPCVAQDAADFVF
jgi:hypothetical protein